MLHVNIFVVSAKKKKKSYLNPSWSCMHEHKCLTLPIRQKIANELLFQNEENSKSDQLLCHNCLLSKYKNRGLPWSYNFKILGCSQNISCMCLLLKYAKIIHKTRRGLGTSLPRNGLISVPYPPVDDFSVLGIETLGYLRILLYIFSKTIVCPRGVMPKFSSQGRQIVPSSTWGTYLDSPMCRVPVYLA